jgi:hypothetical protein
MAKTRGTGLMPKYLAMYALEEAGVPRTAAFLVYRRIDPPLEPPAAS